MTKCSRLRTGFQCLYLQISVYFTRFLVVSIDSGDLPDSKAFRSLPRVQTNVDSHQKPKLVNLKSSFSTNLLAFGDLEWKVAVNGQSQDNYNHFRPELSDFVVFNGNFQTSKAQVQCKFADFWDLAFFHTESRSFHNLIDHFTCCHSNVVAFAVIQASSVYREEEKLPRQQKRLEIANIQVNSSRLNPI